MAASGTYEEPRERPAARARILVRVLCYDDLLGEPGPARVLAPGDLPLMLGRGLATLRLEDRWMSTEHAVLERAGDGVVLRDRGSRNGTYVNGQRVAEHRLADGDLIEVGHTLLCFRETTPGLAEAVATGEVRVGPTRSFSPEMAQLVDDLRRIAPSTEPVLILGETGAGKEICAGLVHELSGRGGPLVTVDCGAVPESLFEATFFGHRRGAFTGASDPRAGEIAHADRGTLFLDEVGNLGAAGQAKLLRVVEDGRVTPLGASEPQSVDVRWIAATNADLFAAGASFRGDLLRRLAGFVARLPPLRARREDLGALAAHLLTEGGARAAAISAAAGRRLFNDPLPGNVRQLRTTLRSAALLAAGEVIETRHIDEALAKETLATEEPVEVKGAARPRPPTAPEIERALEECAGNVVHAATQLGTSARQLYRWIDRLGVSLDRYRAG